MGCGASSAGGSSAIVPGQQMHYKLVPDPNTKLQADGQREPTPPPQPDTRVADRSEPEPAASGPKPVQPAPGSFVRKSKSGRSKRPPPVVTPAAVPLTAGPPGLEPEPEWNLLTDDPAELTRRVCAYMMAHTDRTPSGDAHKDARPRAERRRREGRGSGG